MIFVIIQCVFFFTSTCDIKFFPFKHDVFLYVDTGKIVKKQISKGEDTDGKQNIVCIFNALECLLKCLLADCKYS